MGFSRQKYWSGVQLPSPKLSYDPTLPLMIIYPEETRIEKDTCTIMFTAALFTVAQTWKQLRCPSTMNEKVVVHTYNEIFSSVQFSSVAQSCPNLCDPMNLSTPGLPVHHQLLESTQTHVHQVSDAIQPISSSVIPFSSCPQSFPGSGSFQMS